MQGTSLILTLAITALAFPSHSQSLLKIPSPNATDVTIGAARKATAAVLRKIATPEDFPYLARLGDFEGARQLALRNTDARDKKWMLETLPLYRAEVALRNGDLAGVERELKGQKVHPRQFLSRSAPVWLNLSKRYSELKRPADARRTAFYAVNQFRIERDTYRWGDAAVRLCELGEREAARRFIDVAGRELLVPDPLMGSARGYLVATAARCGFDDIASSSESSLGDFQVVAVYGQQNRDEMARRFIGRQQKKIEAELKKRAALGGQGSTDLTQALGQFKSMFLLELARSQSKRGDVIAAGATLHEANQILDANPKSPGWLEIKAMLLMESEANAVWPLADEIGADIEQRLSAPVASATKSRRDTANDAVNKEAKFELGQARHHYAHAQLGSYRLLLFPEKYSLQQRTEAYHRFAPRALQSLSKHPDKKAKVHYILARWQHNLNLPHWRTTLQSAQDETFKSARTMDNWTLLEPIASEWKLGGETAKARSLGHQLLKRWQQAPLPERKNLLSTTVARVWIAAGQPNEAARILFPPRESNNLAWTSTVTQLAKTYPGPPPTMLLQLPISTRREALHSWAEGVAPSTNYSRMGDDDELYSFLRPIL